MMGQLIDLSGIEFWLVLALAVLLLAPAAAVLPRKLTWAALNIGFVALLLGGQAVAILGGVLTVHLALQAIYGSRFRAAFALLAGLSVLLLFVLHKLPGHAEHMGFQPVTFALSSVGFSYVTLRLVEVLRAVFERRHPPPDLPSMVNYLLPFHMLAAGPIQSYDDFAAQPEVPEKPTQRGVLTAVERIAAGLFKKFVLAYLLQKLFLTDFQAGGLYFVIEVQVFFFWLFLDFSAYSDIAGGGAG